MRVKVKKTEDGLEVVIGGVSVTCEPSLWGTRKRLEFRGFASRSWTLAEAEVLLAEMLAFVREK